MISVALFGYTGRGYILIITAFGEVAFFHFYYAFIHVFDHSDSAALWLAQAGVVGLAILATHFRKWEIED